MKRWIKDSEKQIESQKIPLNSKEIEIDELHSFVKIKKNRDNLSILEQNSLNEVMLILPKSIDRRDVYFCKKCVERSDGFGLQFAGPQK